MKQLISLLAVVAFVLGLGGTSAVLGKGHVQLQKIQVCTTSAKVKEVKANKLQKQLAKGSCLLPSCDFDHVFFKGEACVNVDVNEDGFCDLVDARDSANAFDNPEDATPACYSGNY